MAPQAHGRPALVGGMLLSLAGLLANVPCAWGQSIAVRDLLSRRLISNAGQWPAHVLYAADQGTQRLWIDEDSVWFQVGDAGSGRDAAIRLTWVAAAGISPPRGVGRLPGEHHFLRGADPARWAAHIPAYGCVVFETLDGDRRLRVVPTRHGAELSLETASGAGCREVELGIEGAAAEVERGRGLVLETPVGDLHQRCHDCLGRMRSDCPSCGGGLRLGGDGRLRWTAPATLDGEGGRVSMGLEWSTYLGGNLRDVVSGVAFASDGSVVAAGHTRSMDFPTTPGSFDPTHAPPNPLFFDNDIFLARLLPDGSDLVYSTFLGGAANDFCIGLSLHDDDQPVVVGQVSSADYPTTPDAFSVAYSTGFDAAVTQLSSDGSAIVFSTFLGGSSLDVPNALSLSPDGGILVVGETQSADFPVTPGAYDTVLNGRDGFVTKLAPDGKSLVFSTFLGVQGVDLGTDRIDAVALFPDGSLVLGGQPGSSSFPITPGVLQESPGSSFLARMSGDGSSLLWSTFFGGTASNDIRDVAVDATGTITVVGTVSNVLPPSFVFPTTEGSFDPTFNGISDGFVARVDARGTRLLSSTFLGGGHQDEAWDLVLDPGGVATVFGHTRASNFPVTAGAYDTTHNGNWDFFVARLSPQHDRLFYATYVGGSLADPDQEGREIDLALGPDGEVVIGGTALSVDYPTTPGAFDTLGQVSDGVVSKLTMLPAGVEALGSATPGCVGSLPIGVTASPKVGSQDFGLWSSGAPPAGVGFLGISRKPLAEPRAVLGIELWLHPDLLIALPVGSDALGHAEVQRPIPDLPLLVGKQFWVQFFWIDPCGRAGWSASRALEITLQP